MHLARRHASAKRLAILICLTSLIGAAERSDTPFRTPLIQREEVRFITFDLAVEERGPGGWRPARGVGKDQITLHVGGTKTPLDLFETHCDAAPELEPEPSNAKSTTPPPEATAPGQAPTTPEVVRYILYFEESHLTFADRRNAYRSAIEWVKTTARPTDEAMVVVGGLGLRIVRPMLPVSRHLTEDIEAAMGDFSSTDMWGEGEEGRIEEIKTTAHTAGYMAAKSVAEGYGAEAAARTHHALVNMGRLMTLFAKIEGTKNLILFSDSLRYIPARIYPFISDPSDVYSDLRNVAEAANARDVKIYPVHAAGLTLGSSRDPRADDALTMLASETGGRVVERTNRLGIVFDRVAEDVSCSYRLGFHFRPRYSGGSQRIEVRVGGPARGYRVRHRRSVDDPKPEAMETDSLTAAMLEPSSSREFPVSVRAVPILADATGSRVRIEVSVPIDRLLALPDPNGPPGTRRVLVQIGGRIVPQLEASSSASASDRGAWADVDASREALAFSGQAQVTLPPASEIATIVRVADVRAPAGRYRVVAIVEDRQTGTAASGLVDFRAGAEPAALGAVGVAREDPRSVLIRGGPEEVESEAPRRNRKGPELRFVDSGLPAKSVIAAGGAIEAGRDAEIYYSVCGVSAGDGTLERQISCDNIFAPIDLPPWKVPSPRGEETCALVVEKIPAASLTGDDCELTVTLTPSGHPPERRAFTLHLKYPSEGP